VRRSPVWLVAKACFHICSYHGGMEKRSDIRTTPSRVVEPPISILTELRTADIDETEAKLTCHGRVQFKREGRTIERPKPRIQREGHLVKDAEKILRIVRTWEKARRNREEKATIYKPQTVEAIRMAKTNKEVYNAVEYLQFKWHPIYPPTCATRERPNTFFIPLKYTLRSSMLSSYFY
jgi:hypothetical protein